jgi:para-nitrobenzyl esterase
MFMKIVTLFGLVLGLCMTNTAHAEEVHLQTPQGALIGRVSERDANIAVFKGMPFAKPPVGPRRWTYAEPFGAWKGLRDASAFGPDCVQPSTMAVTADPEKNFFYHPPGRMSEDCLSINVWAPREALESQTKLPVMVWIYGGGFVQGASSWPTYDGARLAAKGVVFVSFNYRVGVFGLFSHPELSAESPHGASGNYYLSDGIEALRWVRDNIAAYGGDPKRVTIFGESAGASFVTELMATPPARGLFNAAIVESGASFIPQIKLKRAEEDGVAFTKAAGRVNIADMRAMPVEDLLAAARQNKFVQRAVDDGWLIPGQVYDIFAKGSQAPVPVITGFNRDESFGFVEAPANSEAYAAFVRKTYGPFAEEVLAHFPATDWPIAQSDLGAYNLFGWRNDTLARFTARAGQNAYLYRFEHIPPAMGSAFHTSEIPYAFGNLDLPFYSANMKVGAMRAEDRDLSETIMKYWVSFARTAGDPKAMSGWTPYAESDRTYLAFDHGQARSRTDLLPGTWALFERINAHRRAEQ